MITYEFSNGLRFRCREETSDFNTVNACGVQDEYDLGKVDVVDKLVFDLGAHIGGCAVWLATRGARVVAVEPIPENVALLHENVTLNNVNGRVTVVEAAVGNPPELLLRYRWNGDGLSAPEKEVADVHAYIGNTGLSNKGFPADTEVWVPTVTLSELVFDHGVPTVIKTDCEGGEWQLFEDPFIHEVPLVVGEWHDGVRTYTERDGTWVETDEQHTRSDIVQFLGPTHDVTFTGSNVGCGGFRAERSS